jgi:hypothetical protein
MNHSYLKRRHRAERADWHANLSLRVHRALSWLDRAEPAAGDLDAGRRIEALVWDEFTGSIRLLLDNKYVFQDFWAFHNGKLEEAEWQRRFAAAKRAAMKALGQRDTVKVLGITLSRLYTLRNQLIHGGATWNSQVNRIQLRDGVNLLGKLVPIVIETMMDHPGTVWGDPCYPVVDPAA